MSVPERFFLARPTTWWEIAWRIDSRNLMPDAPCPLPSALFVDAALDFIKEIDYKQWSIEHICSTALKIIC